MRAIDRIMEAFGYTKASRLFRTDVTTGIYGTMGKPTPQNYQKYMQQYADAAWVYSCVYRIATQAASVPLKLYKKKKKDGQITMDEITDHPLLTLLETVNPFMSGCDLKEATLTYEELSGNAYWLLDMFIGGKPTEIYPLNPHKVKIVPSAKEYVAGYKYSIGGGQAIDIEKEAILHFKYFNPADEYYGLSPLSAGRLAVDTQTSSDTYNRNFFINSAEPRGALVAAGELTEPQRNRIIAGWQAMHRGVANAHKTALFEGEVKWEPIGINQKDMEFISTKKMTREDIMAVFGVPPSLVGVFEYANYANTREQQKIFWLNTMMPKLTKVEAVINSFLVQPYDPNLVCKFDYSGIEALQEDQKIKAEVDAILTGSGIKLINEVREERKWPPVPWGDVWNAPMNLMPILSSRSEEGPEKPEEEGGKTQTVSQTAKTGEPEEISEEDRAKAVRDKIWAYFKRSTESWERKFKPILRRIFTDQEKEVIRNLRDSGWKANPMARTLLEFDYTGKDRVSVLLFSLKEANRIMRNGGTPIISGALEDHAKFEVDRLGLGIEFDVSNPAVQAWIDKKTFKFANEVNKETLVELRGELRAAMSTGEGIKEAEKRVERVFGMARGHRTERIARTEIISAHNNGAMAAYEQSEVVEKKEWISSRDTEVRDSHQIDGEPALLDKPFSNGLMYPGDPAGAAGDVINCRCTISGIIERE